MYHCCMDLRKKKTRCFPTQHQLSGFISRREWLTKWTSKYVSGQIFVFAVFQQTLFPKSPTCDCMLYLRASRFKFFQTNHLLSKSVKLHFKIVRFNSTFWALIWSTTLTIVSPNFNFNHCSVRRMSWGPPGKVLSFLFRRESVTFSSAFPVLCPSAIPDISLFLSVKDSILLSPNCVTRG